MGIQFHAFKYKYVQSMAYRNKQMHRGATRIMGIQFHAFEYN